MTYDEAIDFLYNLEHGSVKLGLERIEEATRALGHPERRYRTVHVAGTNGKGSTAAFLAAILEAAGRRTGLLTSPHLLEYGERIRVGGRMLGRERIAALTTELEPLIRETRLSYFEATTALAFEAFARAGIEAAVIEVGMGGRLDATNVVSPDLTVVTGIALDHTKSLGETCELIAREKAGIMKPGAPLLLADCAPGVEAVFRRRGEELDSPVHRLQDRARLESIEPLPRGTKLRIRRGATGPIDERRIRLCGEHQARNALLADVGGELLGLTPDARARGLEAARWPGRFQVLEASGARPAVIVDVAHNPSGCATVVETYRRWMREPEPVLIVGMLGDKNHAEVFRSLRSLSAHLHLIPLDSSRAAPIERLEAAAAAGGFEPTVHDGFASAWDAARRRGAPILILGSFHTVEAALRHLDIGPEATLY